MIVFLKKNSFHHFRTLSAKTYPNFGRKVLARLSKIQPGCPGEQFGEKNFQEQKFSSFLYFERIHFGLSAKKLSAGLSKLPFTCPDERFEEHFPEKNSRHISAFSDLERTTFGLLAITSGSFVKITFYVSRGTFR